MKTHTLHPGHSDHVLMCTTELLQNPSTQHFMNLFCSLRYEYVTVCQCSEYAM